MFLPFLSIPPKTSMPRLCFRISASAVLLLSVQACKDKSGPPSGMEGLSAALEAGVTTVKSADVSLYQELPGRVSAFREAEVRARVDGIVLKRLFEEGSDVKEGDLLYQIDRAPYQSSLDSARATLTKSESNVEISRLKERRYKTMLAERVTSQQDYEDALAELRGYEADVLSAKAAVEAAEIDLGYTRVTSPLSGRIGKSEVTEGAYVQESAATLMATVRQLDPVYVDVTQSNGELLKLRRSVDEGYLKLDEKGNAPVTLILEDGTTYAHQGKLKFADASVSTGTNSVTIRAEFPNPEGRLLPGMFVRARLVEGKRPDAILVPQEIVSRNQQGKPTVFVVDTDDTVRIRVLETSRSVENQWLVDSGLQAGERVVTDNLQRVSDGAKVKPLDTKTTVAPVTGQR